MPCVLLKELVEFGEDMAKDWVNPGARGTARPLGLPGFEDEGAGTETRCPSEHEGVLVRDVEAADTEMK